MYLIAAFWSKLLPHCSYILIVNVASLSVNERVGLACFDAGIRAEVVICPGAMCLCGLVLEWLSGLGASAARRSLSASSENLSCRIQTLARFGAAV